MKNNGEKLKVGFIGGVNSMPMMVALKFIEAGYDVKYVVDSSKEHTLHRPECHYPEITYPYPDWIKENVLEKYQKYFIPISPRLFLRKIIKEMRDRDVIFFNDYGFQVAKFFRSDVIKLALFSGSDLADHANKKYPYLILKQSGVKKYLYFLMRYLYVARQRKGIRSCHILSYFPKGMSNADDQLISELMNNLRFLDARRYGSTNFKSLGLKYSGAKETECLNILVPVRFLFHPENNDEYKGNDLIIKAVGEVYKINKNIKVHFFDKGSEEDIKKAKIMCDELNINSVVEWHSQMPLHELLQLYDNSDVIIDQVGNHWPGAITFMGLHVGKPVIANIKSDVCNNYWGERCPVLVADNVETISNHLKSCFDFEFRKSVGQRSYAFARKYINTDYYFNKSVEAINYVSQHFEEFKR